LIRVTPRPRSASSSSSAANWNGCFASTAGWWPLASGAEIYAYTDWYLQGYTNFFLYKSREYHTNGNYEGGLKVGYVFPNKDVEVALYARNITDQANLQGGIDFNNRTGFVSDPRVIGVQLSGHL